jgi:hypothetical protein
MNEFVGRKGFHSLKGYEALEQINTAAALTGARRLEARTDGWYDIDDAGVATKLEMGSASIEAGTAVGQLPFWSGTTWAHTETSEFVWDDTNKRVGIGTTTPLANLEVNGSIWFEGGSGDINESGTLTALDGLTAQVWSVGGATITKSKFIKGDVLGTGVISVFNGNLIGLMATGIPRTDWTLYARRILGRTAYPKLEASYNATLSAVESTWDNFGFEYGYLKQISYPAISILNSGNIGFQIDTPTSNFQVNQHTIARGTVSNTAGSTTVTGVDTQFTNTFKIGDTITIGGQTVAISVITSDTVMTTAAITNANTNVAYTLVGGDRFVVKGNGNVGIGTVVPVSKLDIFDTTSITTFQNNTHGAGITIHGGNTVSGGYSNLNFSSGAVSYEKPLGRIGLLMTGSGSYLQFGTSNNYASGITNTAMTIDYNSNVGIGIATPVNQLDVRTTSDYIFAGQGAGGKGFVLANNASYADVVGLNATHGAYNDINFRTSATAGQLYLKSDNTVGIGTTTPGANLEVAGTTTSTIKISSTGATNDSILWFRANNSGKDAKIRYYETNGRIGFMLDDSAGGNVDTLERLTIANDGKIGISVNNPSQQLVVGPITSQNTARINGVSTANMAPVLSLFRSGGQEWINAVYGTSYLIGNSPASYTDANILASSKLLIDSTGKVGIGTTSPGELLHISSTNTTGTGVNLLIENTSTTGQPYAQLKLKANNTNFGSILGGANSDAYGLVYGITISSGTSTSDIGFRTGLAQFSGTGTGPSMIIKPTGDVGIGTTSPTSKLQVVKEGAYNSTDIGFSVLSNVSASYNSWLKMGVNSTYAFIDAVTYSAVRHLSLQPSGGFVGVGTTVPGYHLDIVTTSIMPTTRIFRDQTVSTNGVEIATLLFGGKNYAGTYVAGAAIKMLSENFSSDSTSSLTFSTCKTVVGLAEVMRILSTGSIGIGTTTPTAKLHMVDEVAGAMVILEKSIEASSAPQFFYKKSRGTFAAKTAILAEDVIMHLVGQGHDGVSYYNAGFIKINAAENFTTTAHGAYMSFNTTQIGTATGIERLRIAETGYIGIGVTNPTAKLQILGTTVSETLLSISGTVGNLFTVTDSLIGDIFTISDISAVPIFNVHSDHVSTFSGQVAMGGIVAPTATLHLYGQTAAAGSAPLKFGCYSVLMAVPEAGAFEADDDYLYYTTPNSELAGQRRTILFVEDLTSTSNWTLTSTNLTPLATTTTVSIGTTTGAGILNVYSTARNHLILSGESSVACFHTDGGLLNIGAQADTTNHLSLNMTSGDVVVRGALSANDTFNLTGPSSATMYMANTTNGATAQLKGTIQFAGKQDTSASMFYFGDIKVTSSTTVSTSKMEFRTLKSITTEVEAYNTITMNERGYLGIGTSPSSTLHSVGSFAAGIRTVTSNAVTLDATDYTVYVTYSTGASTITLPAAVDCIGRMYFVKAYNGAQTCTVTRSGTDVIHTSTADTTVPLTNGKTGIFQAVASGIWILIGVVQK